VKHYRMKNWRKLSDKDKKGVITTTAAAMGIPDYVVEKDLWVTHCLREVFSMDVAPHLVFKGGISLSKGWGIIDRFSEDIDLALDPKFFGFEDVRPSRTKVNNLRKTAHKYVEEAFFPELTERMSDLPVEIKLEENTTSDHDPFRVFVEYDNLTKHTQYVKPAVILEIGGRSMHEPHTDREIKSFIAHQFPDKEFADEPVKVPTVNVEKTFLEKIFLLHENFQRSPENRRVARLSRHLYDIYQISKTDFIKIALEDMELYKALVSHRQVFAKIGEIDYSNHFPPYLEPIPSEDNMKEWEDDYKTMSTEMILGDVPTFKQLIKEVKIIVEQINKLKINNGQ